MSYQLAHTPKEIADSPCDLSRFKRGTVTSAERALFAAVRRTVTFENGFVWELADTGLLLAQLVEMSQTRQEYYCAAARRHNCTKESPWTLITGFDEFNPAPLGVSSAKKPMVLSLNIAELDGRALSKATTWITSIVIRSNEMSHILGGWGRCLTWFLEDLLLGLEA